MKDELLIQPGGPGTPVRCHQCGHVVEFGGDVTHQVVKCDECGQHYDYGHRRPDLDVAVNADRHFVNLTIDGETFPIVKEGARMLGMALMRLANA